MAKKNYVLLVAGNHGKRGDVIELDLKDGLSDRQKVIMKEYTKPVINAGDKSKAKVKALTAEVEALSAEVEALKLANADLTEANEALTKTK